MQIKTIRFVAPKPVLVFGKIHDSIDCTKGGYEAAPLDGWLVIRHQESGHTQSVPREWCVLDHGVVTDDDLGGAGSASPVAGGRARPAR